VDAASLDGAITFRSPSGEYAVAGNEEGIIPVSISYRESNNTAVIRPYEPLKGDIAFSTEHISYYLDVSTDVRNASGGGPALWEDWTGRFEVDFPDRDGDGVSDRYDLFPDDETQYVDSDEDGYGDNASGNNPDDLPYEHTQWSDRDGDGYGDNPKGNHPDMFPDDASAHTDTDGDGMPDDVVGVSPTGLAEDDDDDGDGIPDADELRDGTHPLKWDTDGDGVGDIDDPEPTNPAVWVDEGGGDEGGGGEDGDDWTTAVTVLVVFILAMAVSFAIIRGLGRGRD
jgi:hypothetical protein